VGGAETLDSFTEKIEVEIQDLEEDCKMQHDFALKRVEFLKGDVEGADWNSLLSNLSRLEKIARIALDKQNLKKRLEAIKEDYKNHS
jgi:hypothetical protein